jgi:hypothetical protein
MFGNMRTSHKKAKESEVRSQKTEARRPQSRRHGQRFCMPTASGQLSAFILTPDF